MGYSTSFFENCHKWMIFANQSSVMDDIYHAYMRKQRFFHTWTGLANTRKGFKCFLKRYPKKQKPRWSVHQLRKNLKQIFLNFLNFFSRKTKKFSQIESGTTSVFFCTVQTKGVPCKQNEIGLWTRSKRNFWGKW